MVSSIVRLFGNPARCRAVVIVAAATVFWGCTRAGRDSVRAADDADVPRPIRSISQ
jgi:hypothetical protein